MFKKISVGLAVLGAVAFGVYLRFIRPWQLRWGATAEEVHRPLPGDDLVPRPLTESTRAVTIDVPTGAVWSWLVQIGQGRGGFYSYDWLENLLGLDIHSASSILPAYQLLQVGDLVPLAPGSGMTVVTIEPGRALVLHETFDPLTGRMVDRAREHPSRFVDGTWAWFLEQSDGGSTRLLVRFRADLGPSWMGRPFFALFEPIIFIMERKMLLGIKHRAGGSWSRVVHFSPFSHPPRRVLSEGRGRNSSGQHVSRCGGQAWVDAKEGLFENRPGGTHSRWRCSSSAQHFCG